MTVNRCWSVVVLGFSLLQQGSAADNKRSDQDASREKTRLAAKPVVRNDAATGNWELYGAITIRPGKAYVIDSKLDYSTLERVAVSIRLDPQSAADLTSLALQSYWSVPDAEYFNAGEVRSGNGFPFLNTGGTIFQVYGSEFRLVVRNTGDSDIVIQQIVLFCRPA